jgi:hypothetical protein
LRGFFIGAMRFLFLWRFAHWMARSSRAMTLEFMVKAQSKAAAQIKALARKHSKAAIKADFELKKRAEADFAHARALIAAQGCDALVPHAREVFESSFK